MNMTDAEKKLHDLGFNKKKETPKYIYYYFQSDCDKSDRGAIIFDKKRKLKIQAMYVWKPAGLKAAIHERMKELGWI